jgi:DNA-binding PadR family transcriptional regulator
MPPARSGEVERHLPLKPLVFEVLLALVDGERHGWSLVREIQERGSFPRLMPGNFYRTLRALLADSLIAETTPRGLAEDDDERRRTPLGAHVVTAEARRLDAILRGDNARRLLARSRQ